MSVAKAGACLTAMLTLGVAWTEGANVSRQLADSFNRKVALIERQGAADISTSRTPRRTTLSESELNSWFAYESAPSLPTGVTEPRITIVGNQKLIGVATVDLDAVAKTQKSGGTFDIWNLIGGRLPVTVSGLLHAQGGRARFELQDAEINGIPVPRRIVQVLVDYYSRTPDHPQGVRLDQEFELPARIQHIEISPGTAIVVQ